MSFPKALRGPAVAILVLAGSGGPGFSADSGWWLVLGSIATPDHRFTDDTLAAARGIERDARRCGVTAFWDFSSKFSGFARGYTVVVAEQPFGSRSRAERALARARACVPDAYLKRGRYAGE
ncbi:hypothetical protein A33M_2661 [Rhodovulum sp. PH10]|uniref:hypothetical protein n=1 Tax=Rhodovulum sp. PH10 TaxID=1187851 RepID=UPI00027C2369|nr:hypothetical protein [Rhodovulum sp. PH10]EJW11880.1 hypothetical protein A33M_2661 [Rhodovulum sp. PH10]